jgi:glycerol kinase
MSQDAGTPPPHLKVDGGPAGNPYLMQMISDLLNMEVHVSASVEATAIGIANLAGVSAFGTSFEDLSKNWKAEKIYKPNMNDEERKKKLDLWNRAVKAVKGFHDQTV